MKSSLYPLTLFAFVCLSSGLPSMALAQNQEAMSTPGTQASSTQDYVCPMHPHIHGGAGDTCPICGMNLVPSKSKEAPAPASNLSEDDLKGSFQVDTALIQTIGVKHAPVATELFGQEIRAYGRVVPSTREENKVSLRLEGWIENLQASAVGDVLKEGDHLFDLNSPQLIAAQSDYLTARQIGDEDIAKAAAARLTQLGVGKKALGIIRQKGKPLTSVPFYAPADGVVMELNIRTGDYIKPGMVLLSLQDLSTVWIDASVPEADLANIKEGDAVMVNLPEVAKKRPGKVAYIHPVVSAQSRTGQVRIELRNPDGLLKPESFVDVMFSANKTYRLAVPTQAVLRSSSGEYVLRWIGEGHFKPTMVTTGIASSEYVEIKKGVEEGQSVVIKGQFLLDAEANLKSGMGSMASMDHGNMDMEKPAPQSMENMEGMNHVGQ